MQRVRQGVIAVLAVSASLLVVTSSAEGRVDLRLVSGSERTTPGAAGNADLGDSPSRDDGVVFTTSEALVDEDTDADTDVYLRKDGETTLLSRRMPGAQSAGGPSEFPVKYAYDLFGFEGRRDLYVTPDGRTVAFQSTESLVPEDVDSLRDVYVYRDGVVRLVSQGTLTQPAELVGLSDDGQRVFFGTGESLSAADTDSPPARPDDYTAYDVYVSELGVSRLVTGSDPACGTACRGGWSRAVVATTPDGDYALITTSRPLLADDHDTANDCYRVNVATGELQLIGNPEWADDVDCGTLSEDGQVATVVALGNLLPEAEAAGPINLYRWRAATDALTLISRPYATGNGRQAYLGSHTTRISPDGQHAMFLAGTQQGREVDLQLFGESDDGLSPSSQSGFVDLDAFSDDGSTVVFTTTRPETADDTDNTFDLYRSRYGTTTRLTRHTAGADRPKGLTLWATGGISPDGQRITFETSDPLVPEDTNDAIDVYLWDHGKLSLLSPSLSSADAEIGHGRVMTNAVYAGQAQPESLDRVVFTSTDRLVPEDTDDNVDVYEAKVVADPPPTQGGSGSGSGSGTTPPTQGGGSGGGSTGGATSGSAQPSGSQPSGPSLGPLVPSSTIVGSVKPARPRDRVAPRLTGLQVRWIGRSGRRRLRLRFSFSEAATARVTVRRVGAKRVRRLRTSRATATTTVSIPRAWLARRGWYRITVRPVDRARNLGGARTLTVRASG